MSFMQKWICKININLNLNGIIYFTLVIQCFCSNQFAQTDLKLNKNIGENPTDTSFTDSNGNRYEVTNFCAPCACLGEYFECKKFNLKQVPTLPKWVRNLDLTGNKLDDNVENSIGNLTELVSLNLKKNRLKKIPVFKGLLSLEKLILAHNRIQALTEECFLSLPNLKELDLSKNNIRTILPNTFPINNKIVSLNLNFNWITSLEENSLDLLKKLLDLQMNHNRLTALPPGIFKSLSTLKKLDLSENEMDVTWSTFKGLEELRILKLRANGLRYLADSVFHLLKSIAVIELDSNRMTVLNRQGFHNLTSLTTLTLSNNSINRIEENTWDFTQQLVHLDLSHNNLSGITGKDFEYLLKLQRLNLRHNNIKNVADGTFDTVKNLLQLDLSWNKLSWIVEDKSSQFKGLKKLQKLDLSNNNINFINQKAFIGLQSLQILNLTMNNITTLQYNSFEPLQKLHEIILSTEHFLCDCNIQWFYNWLKTTHLAGQVFVVCDYPVNLRGKNLLSLKDENFMCNESPKPRLIKEPSNQLAIKGTNITLECSAISSLPYEMTVQWKKENIDRNPEEIESKSEFTSNNNTITSSYLKLYNVNNEHAGKYQCIIANTFGTTYSQKFKITVATYPGFLKVPMNVSSNSGSNARLDCSAYGEPTPQIAWQKDGGNDFPAARERRMHVIPNDNAFFIMQVKASDMGIYTCTAQNPAGIIKANATLTVFEPPSFNKPIESKEVATGKSCVLECMSSGSPKPSLKWFKDDKPIELSERHFYAADGQILIIIDSKLTDSGAYRCEITNKLGTEAAYFTLTVNKALLKSGVNVEEMIGIVIITVFCCAVLTSIIWIVIIYQTKKGNECNNTNNNNNSQNNNNGNNNGNALLNTNQQRENIDTDIEVSNLEDARYLIIPSRSLYTTEIINMNHFNNTNHNRNTFEENEENEAVDEDRLSCKDSGTGDSGKRSRNSIEDLNNININTEQYCPIQDCGNRLVRGYHHSNQIDNNCNGTTINSLQMISNNKKIYSNNYVNKPRNGEAVIELTTPLIITNGKIIHDNVNSITAPQSSTELCA